MKIRKNFKDLDSTNDAVLSITLPTKCPICKNHIVGQFLYGVYHNNSSIRYTFNLCPACNEIFIATHDYDGNVISCEPNRFVQRSFSKELSELSPQFVKIYNQANAAESSALDEIAGIGYRKALEFLIKDFAISENDNDAEKIKCRHLLIYTERKRSRIPFLTEISQMIFMRICLWVKENFDYS